MKDCHRFFGPHPVLVWPNQKVLPVFGPKTKNVLRIFVLLILFWSGLVYVAVAVTGYPHIIRMRAHWIAQGIAISSTGRAYDE